MNKVEISGTLAREPELKYTEKGLGICTVDIKNVENEKTSWFHLVAFDSKADDLARLPKGNTIGVVGTLRQERWRSATGERRSRVTIIVRDLKILRKKYTTPESDPFADFEE